MSAAGWPLVAAVGPSAPGAGQGLHSRARWGRGRLAVQGGAGPRGTPRAASGEGGDRSRVALASCCQPPPSATGNPHLLRPCCFPM